MEVLVALAMLGVLFSLAMPTFLEPLAHARRTEVQAALQEDAAYMQHYYAAHDAFLDTPAPRLPFPGTPRGGAASYAITVRVPASDPTSFVLTATRTGTMATDPCGDFTLDNVGRRDLVAGTFAAGRSAERCWQ